MSYNGAGTFLINSAGQPVVTGTTISSTAFNALTADLATGLSTCITKNGQTTVTANVPMSSFKLTGLGAGSAAGNSLRYEQLFTTTEVTLLGALGFKKGADIASATTTDLSTATGNFVHITGTTTITAVTLTTGQYRQIIFDGILTLTHHATNNNLPGAANIITAAGDRAVYWSDGTTVYCTEYQRANGQAVASVSTVKNYAINGSFAVNQDVTPTTADNSYPFDGWRLLLGAANAATISIDTADVPTGAGFAAKLVVGSGNNNKFGIFCPIENKDVLDLRSGTSSIRVPLKATAALTNIKIGILQWTSTADAISVTPIAAWGNAGVNPTPIANWAFANTPASQSVTTAWADYAITGISISASATNIGIFIWSDDKTNTQTTDILRVGGYVTLAQGSVAPAAQVAPFDAELRKCQRYFFKTFPQATAPAANLGAGVGGQFQWASVNASISFGATLVFPVLMRSNPSITLYSPGAAGAEAFNFTGSLACTASAAGNARPNSVHLIATDNAGGGQGNTIGLHITANARL